MDWSPLWVSLRASLIATAIVAVSGTALAYLLAKGSFRGRGFLETVATFPMALPPTVVGYYLLITVGRSSPIGRAWEQVLGRPIVLTLTACVIAAAVESFPYCLRAVRAAIEGVDRRLEQAARTMGLPEWRVALQITLPLARRGIAAGVAMGFARALGDFGATITVAGFIPGQTETMPTAVYRAVQFGDYPQAARLSLLLFGVALVILVLVGRLGRVRVGAIEPSKSRN